MTSAPSENAADSDGDAALLANVRPPDWPAPIPHGPYTLLVIGGGPAGVTAAHEAALLGAKVALVERHWLGGESLSHGSVTTKSLFRTGRFYADMQDAENYGAPAPAPVRPDYDKAGQRARRVRRRVSREFSASRLKAIGVDIYFGSARFTGSESVSVDGIELRFEKAMIATGARRRTVDIPGLAEAGFVDATTAFKLRRLPSRILVIGGGADGCEGAQALARLGCHTIIAMSEPLFLPGEERDSAGMVSAALARDGVEIHLNTTAVRVHVENGRKLVELSNDGESTIVSVDEIFVGLGREPAVEGLGLENAAIAYDAVRGIHVDDFLRTSNPRVYAAGDVCLEPKFASIAFASGRMVVANALFMHRKRFSAMTIPWCTYTDPEIAHVGMYVREARERGIPVKTFSVAMHEVDRAIADGEEFGFVKIHIREGSGKILGATIVARHAGEMINEISLAIVSGVGLGTLAKVLRAYPTQAEAIRIAADRYRATRLNWWRRWLARAWLTGR
jgi:pyruvate/2-oxoglutarate dehydrogenase complex dihydrolipoamide dehydrogenase (E3) component